MAHCRARRDPNFEVKRRDAPLPREQLSFREDEVLPGHRLGPPRVRVRAQVRLLAGPGRGRFLEDDPPDAVRHPGVQQGRARGEDPAPPPGADVEPVVHGWKWNLSDIDPTIEGLVVDTLLSDGADKAC